MGEPEKITRRQALCKALQNAGAAALGGAALYLGLRRGEGASPAQTVWQLDPEKCTGCGLCATKCVRRVSPVKCVHAFAICGYCDLCFGYLQPQFTQRDTSAENQLCPTGAIGRTFVEDPYYQYTVDQSLCIGCGKCVKGCTAFGNGSLFLQVIHGDMSFAEWLRAQGEEHLAQFANMVHPKESKDSLFDSLRRAVGLPVEDGQVEDVDEPGSLTAAQLQSMPKLGGNAGRKELFKLFDEYRSQLGRIPRCLNCNECSIAVACPARAFVRRPADQPYLLKKPEGKG